MCKEQGDNVLRDLFHGDDDSAHSDESATDDPTIRELSKHFASLRNEHGARSQQQNDFVSGLSDLNAPLIVTERGSHTDVAKGVNNDYLAFIGELTTDKEKAPKKLTVPSRYVPKTTSYKRVSMEAAGREEDQGRR